MPAEVVDKKVEEPSTPASATATNTNDAEKKEDEVICKPCEVEKTDETSSTAADANKEAEKGSQAGNDDEKDKNKDDEEDGEHKQRYLSQFYKTKMCKFFLKHECKLGNECSHAHDPSELRQAPDLARTKFCPELAQKGRCSRIDCTFAHRVPELRATAAFFKTALCSYHLRGECKMEGTCRHAHTVEELQISQDGGFSQLQSDGRALPYQYQQQVLRKQEQFLAQQKLLALQQQSASRITSSNTGQAPNPNPQGSIMHGAAQQQTQLTQLQLQQQLQQQQQQLFQLQLQQMQRQASPGTLNMVSPMVAMNPGNLTQMPQQQNQQGNQMQGVNQNTAQMVQDELEKLKLRQLEEQQKLIQQQQAQQQEHARQLQQLQESLSQQIQSQRQQCVTNNSSPGLSSQGAPVQIGNQKNDQSSTDAQQQHQQQQQQQQGLGFGAFAPSAFMDTLRQQARTFLGRQDTNQSIQSNGSMQMNNCGGSQGSVNSVGNSPFMSTNSGMGSAPCTPGSQVMVRFFLKNIFLCFIDKFQWSHQNS